MGTYAVQLARHFGAEVTAVCSTANVDLVMSLGAHHVIDYTQEDFTKSGKTYDIIFDTVGKSSFRRCKGSLTKTGSYVSTTGLLNYVWVAWTRLRGGKRVLTGMSVDKDDALRFVKSLIESGGLRIVIDSRYTLNEIVDAHRYVDSGRKRGNVVVTVQPTP
ncbi:MAG TPA: NAD(P)-dependent alcohol dehydrogenase [Euzebya sp.]|nr:NAD(P)-dependent alcohol dehydrogenase [Euzebya sp.]